MNPEEMQELKELIEFLRENKIGEFALERGELKVQLKFQSDAPPAVPPSAGIFDAASVARLLNAPHAGIHVPAQQSAAVAAAPAAEAPPAPAVSAEPSLYIVKSPIVGTFYESASPGASAFVKPGDQIEVGQALCIIEAMKLMNEIESDVAGEVVKRLVQNGQPVEFGQPLFSVKPR
jgi:acetyl-CoA carboxylase biotin carboxyl carrier protein